MNVQELAGVKGYSGGETTAAQRLNTGLFARVWERDEVLIISAEYVALTPAEAVRFADQIYTLAANVKTRQDAGT